MRLPIVLAIILIIAILIALPLLLPRERPDPWREDIESHQIQIDRLRSEFVHFGGKIKINVAREAGR